MTKIKTTIKIVSIFLLTFTALTALFGGWALMRDTTGSLLQLSLEKLEPSPFHNYFIPGISLFLFLGCGSLLSLNFIIKNHTRSPWFLLVSGAVTSGWIVIQILFIQSFHWLQVLYLAIGGVLICFGLLLQKKKTYYTR